MRWGAVLALRGALAEKRPVIGTFLGLGSAIAAEICAQSLEWLVVDLEHGVATEADLAGLLQAAECGGAACLVRVAALESTAVGRALDLGAAGIMFPGVDTAAEARAAVARTRPAPEGSRGVARMIRARGYGADRQPLDSSPPVVAVQIESRAGVAAAAEIAAVDGVDALFVGPTDLAHDLSWSSGDAELEPAVEQVLAAAKRRGKPAGLMVPDWVSAARWIERGATLIAVASDAGLLADVTRGLRRAGSR